MATRKRPILLGRAFKVACFLFALLTHYGSAGAREGYQRHAYYGHIACLRCSQTIVPAYAEGSPVVPAGYAVAVAGAYVAAAPVTAGVAVVAIIIVPVGTAAVIRPRVGISLAVELHGCGICIIAATVYAVSYYACRFGFAMSAVASAGKSRLCGGKSAPAPAG